MNEDNKKLLKLYNLAEIAYENKIKKLGFNEENLYPDKWYKIKNYKQKIEILGEAINTNNLIINTSKYQTLIKNKKCKIYVNIK